jgi:hypothetical protein
MHRRPTAIAVLALAACSGNDTTVNKLQPDLVVATEALDSSEVDFGEVVVPYGASQYFQVLNAGRAPLEVSSIALADDEGVFTLSEASLTVEQDEAVSVQVDFLPATYLPYSTEIILLSNDPDEPEKRVPLLGEGVDGPVPSISVDPLTLDFGDVAAGSSSTLWFTVTNVGDGPLSVEPTLLSGSGNFALVTDPGGQTLAEDGGAFTSVVTYTRPAGQETGDWGRVEIPSNDPRNPSVEVLFLANGGGDYEYPVALIDAPDAVVPLDTVVLDGTGSYDPEGFTPLSYSWTLETQPEVSTTELSDSADDAPTLFIDAAGEYAVSLRVMNTIGVLSAPARWQVEAVPEDDVYVILSWSTNDSDLDLHLLRGGAEFYEKPGDCCWCNPNPSWGESGTTDDPALALDNRVGRGPENINIEQPADDDYSVRVHYFQDNGGGTTAATVQIYVEGLLQYEESRQLTHNQLWDVAYVRWPAAVVVEENADPYAAPARDCD